MRITPQRIFYDGYTGDKTNFSTYMRRVKEGIPMEEAIFKKLDKSYLLPRKPGSGQPKGSVVPVSYRKDMVDEETKKQQFLESYRNEINAIREETEKAQIRNRIVGDLDPYYVK